MIIVISKLSSIVGSAAMNCESDLEINEILINLLGMGW